jgi:hypothetical protein
MRTAHLALFSLFGFFLAWYGWFFGTNYIVEVNVTPNQHQRLFPWSSIPSRPQTLTQLYNSFSLVVLEQQPWEELGHGNPNTTHSTAWERGVGCEPPQCPNKDELPERPHVPDAHDLIGPLEPPHQSRWPMGIVLPTNVDERQVYDWHHPHRCD